MVLEEEHSKIIFQHKYYKEIFLINYAIPISEHILVISNTFTLKLTNL